MLDKIGVMVRTWWQRPHWFAEFWSSVVLVGFGVGAIMAPAALVEMRTFTVALKLMPEGAWGCATGAVGLFQFGALWADSRWLRAAAAAAATWLMAEIALCAVLSLPSPLAMFPLGFLGLNMFALARAAGNAR